MAERGLKLRLGLFMGASLIALASLVVLFGGAPQLFSTDARYGILYPEAPGVSPGTPIRKSGVRVGKVTAVELDPTSGQVRVRIAIQKQYLPRKNEEAHITRGLLSGDTAIDFLPQPGADGQPLPRGEEWPVGSDIPGVAPFSPRSLVAPASLALANAQQSLDRITKAFEKMEKIGDLSPKVEKAVDEATGLFKDIRAFIPELRKTNLKIQGLISSDAPPAGPAIGPVVPIGFVFNAQPKDDEPNLKGLIRDAQEALRSVKPAVDDFRATIKKIEPDITAAVKGAKEAFAGVNDVLSPENRKQIAELLKNLNAVSVNVMKFSNSLGTFLDTAEKTVKNIDSRVTEVGAIVADVRAVTMPLAARAESLVKSVVDSAGQFSKMLAEIRGLVGTFAKENGTIQQLLTDPGVYRNLDDAAGSLARILTRAEKITRDLEVFADKVARRPELIGVGGAIRPSAGLKELPGVPSFRPDWPPAASSRPFTGPAWLEPRQLPPVQGYAP